MSAFVVVDLGFGDAGKGTIVDYLVRRECASLVVRFNGGAQAGHNVVTDDGRHHTFAQIGAGTFVPGVRTHLAETVVVHPTALLVEEAHLRRAGVHDALERLTISADALVTTPFHQAVGRLRELVRSEPHGTCGVGVGETVRGAILEPDVTLRARDLTSADLVDRLEHQRARLQHAAAGWQVEGPDADRERALLGDPEVSARWLERVQPLIDRRVPVIVDDIEVEGSIVLEGAQGVLLDESWGFHPHTTWSNCTTANAEAWLRRHSVADLCRVGVVRTYMTRHGCGPLPSACAELDELPEPHNDDQGWQGTFRRGWPDPVLWRYALAATQGVDALAVTHLDRLAGASHWYGVSQYDRPLPHLRPRDLDEQAARTREVARARIELVRIPHEERGYLEWLQRELEVPVSITSRGPAASHKARWPR